MIVDCIGILGMVFFGIVRIIIVRVFGIGLWRCYLGAGRCGLIGACGWWIGLVMVVGGGNVIIGLVC